MSEITLLSSTSINIIVLVAQAKNINTKYLLYYNIQNDT
jgi:hypothetical protein